MSKREYPCDGEFGVCPHGDNPNCREMCGMGVDEPDTCGICGAPDGCCECVSDLDPVMEIIDPEVQLGDICQPVQIFARHMQWHLDREHNRTTVGVVMSDMANQIDPLLAALKSTVSSNDYDARAIYTVCSTIAIKLLAITDAALMGERAI